MEQNDSNIFEHGLDETAKAHLLETTRWTKFLAIIGFIFTGLLVVGALLAITMGSMFSSYPGMGGLGSGLGAGIGFIYLILAVIYLYPVYALFKFSSCMKRGINTGSQDMITDAFRYQKNMYRFIGIMMIIVIAIYLLAFIVLIGVGVAQR
jgi:amino acid permease